MIERPGVSRRPVGRGAGTAIALHLDGRNYTGTGVNEIRQRPISRGAREAA
jgi:hypothetical protein